MARIEKPRQECVRIITCVRNPWARIYSVWKFAREVGRIPGDTGFEEFVNYMPYANPGRFAQSRQARNQYFLFRHTTPTFYGAFVESGTVDIDYVMYFENLADALEELSEILGLPVMRLPELNRSMDRSEYVDHYSRQMQQKIRDLYRNDIALFGYEYGVMPAMTLVRREWLNRHSPGNCL